MSIIGIPEDKSFYVALAREKVNEGDYDQAVKYYFQALSYDPDDEDTLSDIAETYFKMGAYQESAYLYAKMVNKNPRSMYAVAALTGLWYNFDAKHKPEFSGMSVSDKQSERILLDNFTTNKNMLAVVERSSAIVDAERACKNADNEEPFIDAAMAQTIAHLGRAYMFKELGMPRNVLLEASNIKRDDICFKEALELIVEAFYNIGEPETARKYTDYLEKLDEFGKETVRFRLFQNCKEQGVTDEFYERYSRYVKHYAEVKDAECMEQLVRIALFAGCMELSRETAYELAEIKPYDVNVWTLIMSVELLSGNLDAGRSAVCKMKAIYPENPQAAFIAFLYDWYAEQYKKGHADRANKTVYQYVKTYECGKVLENRLQSRILRVNDKPYKHTADELWTYMCLCDSDLTTFALQVACERYPDRAYEFCVRILANPNYSPSIKRHALRAILREYECVDKTISIVSEEGICTVTPKSYGTEHGTLGKEIYLSAYAALAVGAVPAESDCLKEVVDELMTYIEAKHCKWTFRTYEAIVHYEYLLRTEDIGDMQVYRQRISDFYEITQTTFRNRHKEVYGNKKSD